MNTVAKIRQSYPRIESECGFGNCAWHHACRDKHCPEHPNKTGMLGLPVIDEQFLDEQLYQKDVKSFGGLDDLPVEMIEPIPSVMRDVFTLKTALLAIALIAAIAWVLSRSTP